MLKRRSKKKTDASGPSRHLIEVSPHRTTGGVHVDELTPYPAEYESAYEKLTIPLLLICHDVQKIYSQQERSYLDKQGNERKYTADFAVELTRTDKLLEVKSLGFLVHPEQWQKYQDIARYFRKEKQPFGFIVDAQLLQQPLKSTANLLFRYVTGDISLDVIERATNALRAGPMAIHELCSTSTLELRDIYTLLAKRHLCIDWDIPLSKASEVSLPNKPYAGLSLERLLRSTRHADLLATLALGRGAPDQHRLADAAAWRQARRPLTPWSFIGGFSGAAPIRDLREEELRTRKSWERGDRAPGKATKPVGA